jgi:hypothetical protein
MMGTQAPYSAANSVNNVTLFQQQQHESESVCISIRSVIRRVARKIKKHREATDGASIFDRSSRRRRRAQRDAQGELAELEARQQLAELEAQRLNSSKLSIEAVAGRIQKRRDAYLNTFQRNQVQMVSPTKTSNKMMHPV